MIERLGHLRAAYLERIQGERAAERLMNALDVLFERPILNIRQLEAALNVPYRTAQRYIERLAELGILWEVTGQMRIRIYQADEILGTLES
jgi:Fic family protein